MLFITLTDGHQTVEAIEYQPIRQINVEELLPGAKVNILLNGLVLV